MSEENKMTKGGNDITEENWEAYRTVQDSGLHNMFSPQAIMASGLDKNTYMAIVKNYSALEDKYEDKED